MKKFKHVDAGSVEQTTSILKEYGGKAKVLAGGTDLVGEMRENIVPDYPEVVINLKTIPGMDYIKDEGQSLKIGAMTRLEDIANDEAVKKNYSIIAEAAHRTASPHIREMGTISGNICQTNRCWYYWVADNRFDCIRKGGKQCYALIGDGRYHSIFGATKVDNTPCTANCPTNVDIPAYMSKIREDNIAAAAEILLSNNPFPAITGRVCPHFCQSACNRTEYDDAVSVRNVERFIGDYVLNNAAEMYKAPKKETGKKVAVVGAGPAGLSVAFYLRKLGHAVVVFDQMEEPGGMLMYGIPPYRLPKDIVKNQAKALADMGIEMKLGVKIGEAVKFEELVSSYDAVFLACGCWKERPSGIEGEDLLMSGTAFLNKSNAGIRNVPGKKIAVIGGGNVAIDVVRTLLRLGCEPEIVYRRSRDEMPALAEEVEKAEEEGIKMNYLTQPVAVAKKGNGVALTCVRMELGEPDESGRRRPVPVKGSEYTMDFDAVMKAIGEVSDYSILPAEYVNAKGRIDVDENTYAMSGKVFAGGDCMTGAATVVAAFAAGRKAAGSIDKYLGGTGKQEGYVAGEDIGCAKSFNSPYLEKSVAVEAEERSVADRLKEIDVENVSGLDEAAIKAEANRCFNCGCVAVNPSDMAPALIALDAKVITSRRTLDAIDLFAVQGEKSTMLDDDEIVTEVVVPKPAAGVKTKFIKFALRKSIDFPVVNIAASIESDNGVVKNARICLNAVYNNPCRMIEAEKAITGKAIDEATAEAAAEAAMTGAFPVRNNKYKINIAKALVKRAILACK